MGHSWSLNALVLAFHGQQGGNQTNRTLLVVFKGIGKALILSVVGRFPALDNSICPRRT